MTKLHTSVIFCGLYMLVILWHIRSSLLILIFISVAFPQTIKDWNAIPDSLISSAEGAEDGVAKFSSLVRAGANLHGPGPGE